MLNQNLKPNNKMPNTELKFTPGLSKVVNSILDFVKQNLAEKIEVEHIYLLVNSVITKLQQTSTVLSDSNTDNSAQLKLIWSSILSDAAVNQSIKIALSDAIANIKDPTLKEGLELLTNPIIDTIAALTDTATNNAEQVENIWKTFLKSELFLLFVVKNLEVLLQRIIKNDEIGTLISKLLTFLILSQKQ